jgi:hypothetical protein
MFLKIDIIKNTFLFCILICMINSSCHENKPTNVTPTEARYRKKEKEAIDILVKNGIYNYLDSAYWYTYIYFGRFNIKKCGAVDIDSVLPTPSERRIIYQDLVLQNTRLSIDSPFVFLWLTPLVRDSILSCDMIEGSQLPHEIMFNYKTKSFVQFVYEENSWLRIKDVNPIRDYNDGLRKILDSDNLEPHPKFKNLLNKLNRSEIR